MLLAGLLLALAVQEAPLCLVNRVRVLNIMIRASYTSPIASMRQIGSTDERML